MALYRLVMNTFQSIKKLTNKNYTSGLKDIKDLELVSRF